MQKLLNISDLNKEDFNNLIYAEELNNKIDKSLSIKILTYF